MVAISARVKIARHARQSRCSCSSRSKRRYRDGSMLRRIIITVRVCPPKPCLLSVTVQAKLNMFSF